MSVTYSMFDRTCALIMDSKFGSLTIPELKKELKKRNAKQSGRKKDLVERCVFFLENIIYGCRSSMAIAFFLEN